MAIWELRFYIVRKEKERLKYKNCDMDTIISWDENKFDDKFYEASLDNIKKIIVNSHAFKFCENPQEYIENY